MLPAPVQSAMIAALGDDAHVAAQKERYRARRATLKPALEAAGFRIDRSEAGLYLWATEGRDAWESLGRARRSRHPRRPGHFYGEPFPQHVALSLTATDERIAAAAARLRAGIGGFLQRMPAAFGRVRSRPMRPLGCKARWRGIPAPRRLPDRALGCSAAWTTPPDDQKSRGGAVSDAGTSRSKATLTIGDKTAEFPLLAATDGVPSVDISTLHAPDRAHDARLRLRQHRGHASRRSPSSTATRASCATAATRSSSSRRTAPTSRSPGCSSTASCPRRRAGASSTSGSATTRSCTKTSSASSPRFRTRRTRCRCSRRRSRRCRPTTRTSLDPNNPEHVELNHDPHAREAAGDRGVRAQEEHRPGVPLPRQLAELRRQLPQAQLRRAGRARTRSTR